MIRSDNAAYLDSTCFKEGVRETKLALVKETNSGIARDDTGFYKLYVKDVNSRTLRAFIFRIADFLGSGLTLAALKNKPVNITFVPQLYNGQWSLVLESIELWKGAFDFAKFRGTISIDSSMLEETLKELFGDTRLLRAEYRMCSLGSVLQGRVGGFMYLVMAGFRILASWTGLPGVEAEPLLKCYFIGMSALFDHLRDIDKFEIPSSAEAYHIVEGIQAQYKQDPYLYCILDACRSLVGVAKPEHLYAHLIKDAVDFAFAQSELVLKSYALPNGARISLGGDGVLLKY